MTINFSQIATLDDCLATLAEAIPPVVSTDSRQYPFIGEKGVRRALEAHPELRIANAVLMYHLQEAHEQASRETKDKNHRGLMSSHAATATKVVQTLLAGGTPDEESVYKADGFKFSGATAYLTHVGGRYAKQLSVALRSWAIGREPALAVTAQMFSVK